MHIIEQHADKLRELCEQHAVRQLHVFGSVLTNRFTDQSDIDFLVDFDEPADPVAFGLLLMDFERELAQLFGREVEVVVSRYVQNPFFRKNIDQHKCLIYDRRSQKMPAGH